MDKRTIAIEYQVNCNGKTNHPSLKGLLSCNWIINKVKQSVLAASSLVTEKKSLKQALSLKAYSFLGNDKGL